MNREDELIKSKPSFHLISSRFLFGLIHSLIYSLILGLILGFLLGFPFKPLAPWLNKKRPKGTKGTKRHKRSKRLKQALLNSTSN